MRRRLFTRVTVTLAVAIPASLACDAAAALQIAPRATVESYLGVNRYDDTLPASAKVGRELDSDAFLAGGLQGTWDSGSFAVEGYYSAASQTLGVDRARVSLFTRNLAVSVGKQAVAWGAGETFQPTYFLSFVGPLDGPFATAYNTAQVWSVVSNLSIGGSDTKVLAAMDSAAIEKLTAPSWFAGLWRQTFYPSKLQFSYDIGLLSRSSHVVAHLGSDIRFGLTDEITLIASGDLGVDVPPPQTIFQHSLTRWLSTKSFLVGATYSNSEGMFLAIEGGYDGFWAGGVVTGYDPPGAHLGFQLTGRADLQSEGVMGLARLTVRMSADVTNILEVRAYGGSVSSPLSTGPLASQIRYFIEYKI